MRREFSEIAKVLLRERKRRGFSQLQLARAIGYKNGQIISNTERGLAGIPAEKIHELCVKLHTNPIHFISASIKDYEDNLRRIYMSTVPPSIPTNN